MKWLEELLDKRGLDQAVIAGIIGDVRSELPKYCIPKGRYNKLAEARRQSEQDQAGLSRQLSALKQEIGVFAAMAAELEEMRLEQEAAASRRAEQLRQVQLSALLGLTDTAGLLQPSKENYSNGVSWKKSTTS